MAITSGKELKVRFAADTAALKKGFSDVERTAASFGDKLKSVGSSMTSVGKTATLGLTLPLVAFGKTAIDSFGEAQRVAAQTDAVLKSTGGAAGVTADGISNLSDRIGKLAAVDNDAIQAGANMLLTFTNIRNEAGKGNNVFDQTLKVTQDVASAMGTDTKSAALQLGKALNDPAAGVTKLTRIGVTFTEQQKKQIAALSEAGNTMGAQKIILAELSKEFGGSAKAAGDTATPFQKMALTMDDLGESVGAVLAPMLTKLADVAARVADWFNNLSPAAKDIAVKIALVAAAIGPLLIIGGKLVSAIGAISNAFKALSLANPWTLIIAGAVLLAIVIIKNWDKIKGFVVPVLQAIKTVALAVWNAIKTAALVVWNAIKGVVEFAWKAIKGYFAAYLAVGKAVFVVVKTVAVAVWKVISGAVKIAWSVIRAIAKAYAAVWRAIFHAIAAVAKAVWKAIVAVVRGAWAVIRGVAGSIKTVFVGTWNTIKSVATGVWRGIVTVVRGVWTTLKGIGNSIKGFFVDVWNGIKDKAADAWNWIVETFKGAVNGILGAWNSLDFEVGPWSIPTWVPVFGGKTFHIADLFPDVPLLANGGTIRAAGAAIVGERGPEVVTLGRGATVTPLPSGGGMTLNLDRRRFGRGYELETLTRGR